MHVQIFRYEREESLIRDRHIEPGPHIEVGLTMIQGVKLSAAYLTSSSPLIIRLVPEGLLGTHKGQRQTSTPATHSRRYVRAEYPSPTRHAG